MSEDSSWQRVSEKYQNGPVTVLIDENDRAYIAVVRNDSGGMNTATMPLFFSEG